MLHALGFQEMMVMIILFVVPPALIAIIFFYIRKTKHKERMALIEKGIDPSIYMKAETTLNKVLLWGMLISGIGFGLLLGYILSVYTPMKENTIRPIMALLFGGLGLVGYYVYRKKTGTKSAE